ncbi:hypoxanthine phosphoribosyltransferase [Rhodocytophaga rosea]|uniref:Hypoxanthine phosphoribosyltransferase n=1 Tax=Rhodocytophaga rosea TaxID=2704465 RepID=A0A6C0GR82_9BACT|nr:hypoxanthine phosphoribosyltransferase [Rhodocytophaga rosea]QHT70010.1 hypoxanthine phosphoribosyltransferase [Rhodocytophaga rosea]
MVQLKDKEFEVYISHQDLTGRIQALASQISQQYEGRCPLFVAILNGAFMFAAHLLQHISIPCEITFIKVASYQALQSTGKITELLGLNEDISGRDVIIVEDIVDSGLTMEGIVASMKSQNPRSVQVATLLFKPQALRTSVELHYVGFEIPNAFVVGFGLDYDGLGRNLQDLYVLKEKEEPVVKPLP